MEHWLPLIDLGIVATNLLVVFAALHDSEQKTKIIDKLITLLSGNRGPGRHEVCERKPRTPVASGRHSR